MVSRARRHSSADSMRGKRRIFRLSRRSKARSKAQVHQRHDKRNPGRLSRDKRPGFCVSGKRRRLLALVEQAALLQILTGDAVARPRHSFQTLGLHLLTTIDTDAVLTVVHAFE